MLWRTLTTLSAVLVLALSLGPLNAASWFKRGDPQVTTLLYVYRPHLLIFDHHLGVYPFAISQGGHPQAPEMPPFLTQALLQGGSVASAATVPAAPWDETPEWHMDRWSEARRIAAVAEDGRTRGFDFVVLGRVDEWRRTAAHGLIARVTVWLVSTADGRVVWYGAKKADWLRRFPDEDCALRLAWEFVANWRPPKPP